MKIYLLALVLGLAPAPIQVSGQDSDSHPPSSNHAEADEAGRPFLTCFNSKEHGGAFQTWDFAQDDRGVLYAGNNLGVLEYDGATWRLIDTGSTVRGLAHAPDGRIYVGAFGSFGYLAPDSAGNLEYVSLLPYVPEAQRAFNDVWTVYAAGNDVYFQARERLFRFRQTGSDWDVRVWEPQDRFMYAFLVDGTYYVHQSSVGLMKLVDDRFELIPGTEALAGDRMQVMLPFDEQSGRMLLGSFHLGLYLFDGRTLEPFRTQADPFLLQTTLYKGVSLSDGSFGLLTTDLGFFVVDRAGNLERHLDKSSGLNSSTLYAAFVDRARHVWLAPNDGICQIETPSPLSRYDESLGLVGAVSDVIRHRGTLYAATESGLYILDSEAQIFRPIAGLSGSRQAFKLLEFGDHLLASTNGGLYRVDGVVATVIRGDVAGDYSALGLHRSLIDSNRVFVGLGDGLGMMRRRPGGQWVDEGRVPGISEYLVDIVEAEPGVLWLGTAEQGVLRVRYTRPDSFIIDRYGKNHGLTSDGGVSVFETSTGPLFAMQDGVFRLDSAVGRFYPDTLLSTVVGFGGTQDEYVSREDHAGNLWVNFGQDSAVLRRQSDGTYRVDKTPLMRFADVPAYAIYPEPNGVVWFGGAEGLIRYDATVGKNYEADFPVLIRRVTVGEDSTLFGGAGLGDVTGGELDYAHNALRISFAAPSYENSRENLYQSMLDGFDTQWSAWTKENRRDYTNVPPGDYTFRVRARNVHGHESAEAAFALSIMPPWYRTWWAYLLYGGVASGLVFGLIRQRTRQLEVRQRELESIVDERTAEIQQRVVELDTVNHISHALVAQLEFDALVHLVGEQMRETFRADIVYVALHDRESNLIRFPYEHGDTNPTRPFGSGLTEKIMSTREPLLINRDMAEVRRQLQARQIGKVAASYLGVPIVAGDEAIGVISVQTTADENRFDADDLRLLSTIAANVGIALQNADAYRRLNVALENLRSTQEQLVQQEKMASLGALTAGIAHEIKNPLNFIGNFAGLNAEFADELEQELEAGTGKSVDDVKDNLKVLIADLRQNARVISHHSQRADSIVRSMMQHASGGTGERVPTDLNALVSEYVDLAYHGKRAQMPDFNVEIEQDLDGKVGTVALVPQEMGRVILNLLSNAFDAVREKGGANPRVTVATRRNNGHVEIRVRDNGPGMPEEVREKIFEPFFTTKPPGSGTGLGLSLSYDIVIQRHGGTFVVESTEGDGASFIITLPSVA